MPSLSAIVPTLGMSRWLVPCLEALRRDGGDDLEILLVVQGDSDTAAAERLADGVLRLPANVGFAAANNLGLAAAGGDYLATVNDDAIIAEGWCHALLDVLEQRPEAAAVQGINLRLDDTKIVDGGGLAWNRWWQAVQIGHGEPLSTMPEAMMSARPVEIFGVSATAAIYRRSALTRLTDTETTFDPRLFAYYEDVDLACRLRGIGCQAFLVPAATVHHAGSTSGRQLRGGKQRLIYRNRQLVVARLLGRTFWLRWPGLLLRDATDLWHAARRGQLAGLGGIIAGLAETLVRWPSFARSGGPLVPLAELRRFRAPARKTTSRTRNV